MSSFPEVVWLKVFSYLSLDDKNRLSQSCKLLHSLFHDPFLWKDAVFYVPPSKNMQENLMMAGTVENYKQMVFHFGKYIRNLSIIIKGRKIKDIFLQFIGVLLKECSDVEKLTIDVGKWDEYSDPHLGCKEGLTALSHFTTSFSDTLYHLNLDTWPCTDQGLFWRRIIYNR